MVTILVHGFEVSPGDNGDGGFDFEIKSKMDANDDDEEE